MFPLGLKPTAFLGSRRFPWPFSPPFRGGENAEEEKTPSLSHRPCGCRHRDGEHVENGVGVV